MGIGTGLGDDARSIFIVGAVVDKADAGKVRVYVIGSEEVLRWNMKGRWSEILGQSSDV